MGHILWGIENEKRENILEVNKWMDMWRTEVVKLDVLLYFRYAVDSKNFR